MSGNFPGGPDDRGDVEPCPDWHDVLSAMVDGEADPAEEVAAHRHLAGCAACAARVEALHHLRRRAALRAAADGADLAPLVRAWAGPAPVPAPTRGRRRRRPRRPAALLAAACLVVVALGGWTAQRDDRSTAAAPAVEADGAFLSSAEVGGSATLVLTLRNQGGEDALVDAGTDVAPTVALHRVGAGGGMRSVDLFPLGAGQERRLRLDASHLMLLDVNRSLRPGAAVRVELRFERAAPLVVEARVLTDEQLLARHAGPAQ